MASIEQSTNQRFDLYFRFLGMFLQKLSQQSLNTFPEVNVSSIGDGGGVDGSGGGGGDGSEPGYESLPDHSSNDPGYETVVEKSHSKDSKKDGSDYDPNYETLRPTIKSDSIDHYAKVLNKSQLDSNDGYCTISDDRIPEPPAPLAKNHDYASIGTDLHPPEENVYSSITNDIDRDEDDDVTRVHGNTKSYSPASTASSPIPMSSNTALTMSMTSAMSADTKTLTSPSSEGDSSSNTPICYKSIRSTDRSQLTVSVSNYDSLTGSDSDSNYESVRYLNAQDRENPYEQLYNESDIKYDTLKRADTADSSGLYAISAKNADFSKNSSLSSSSGSGLGGRSSSSLNNPSSDTAG